MQKFLQIVVDDLYNRFGQDLYKQCLIFPNNRTIRFFEKELKKKSVKAPILAPCLTTINRLFEDNSDIKLADDTELLLILYKQATKENITSDSFDKFFSWGNLLLGDFDDIDKYLADAEKLFTNISDIKEIESLFLDYTDEQIEVIRQFWKSVPTTNDKKYQQDFLKFWTKLNVLYSNFKETLLASNKGYQGMIYRDVYDRIAQNNISILGNYDNFIFIGLNALNKIEEEVLYSIHKQQKALFYWDYDNLYVDKEYHQAGFFIRRNMQKFPNAIDNKLLFNNLRNKTINTVNTTSNQNQIEYVAQAIANERSENAKIGDNHTTTAIILGDETLALPLLSMCNPKDINVSIGFPMGHSQWSRIVNSLGELYKNSKIDNGKKLFYQKDISQLLLSPFVSTNISNVSDLLSGWERDNKYTISAKELPNEPLFNTLFKYREDFDDALDSITNVLSLINDNNKNSNNGFVETIDNECYKLINNFLVSLKEYSVSQSVKLGSSIIFKLLNANIKASDVPFDPNPDSNIHIIGLMESRGIDFDKTIITSVNEGTLPTKSSTNTLVPFNLRKGFGLPTTEQKDGMFAYYFYRSLQRSSKVTLIYSNVTEAKSTAEPSRYIHQLEAEGSFTITKQTISPQISIPSFTERTIVKDAELIKKMDEIYVSGTKAFSASAFNDYNNCKLKFYFKSIAGIKEPDEASKDIDNRVFGNIVHKALELLYNDYIGKEITANHIDTIIKDKKLIDEKTDQAFADDWFKKDVKDIQYTGISATVKQVVKKYIGEILKFDKKRTPFTIVSLERWIDMPFAVTIDDKEKNIRIGGFIDRLEEKDNVLYPLDYKTGKVENSFVDIQQLFDQETNSKTKGVFQTFIYSMLTEHISNREKTVCPGLIFIKHIHRKDFNFNISQKKVGNITSYTPYRNEFESELRKTIEEIFNSEIPFSPTIKDEKESCAFCPYSGFCKRVAI